ncbi:Chromodomain-helicase-DNA-binding protein 2 [Sesbania bispinosa]|nr:Chromodomain-helicase-DNA-binding protein 2 [Sesbania bispinosa]
MEGDMLEQGARHQHWKNLMWSYVVLFCMNKKGVKKKKAKRGKKEERKASSDNQFFYHRKHSQWLPLRLV